MKPRSLAILGVGMGLAAGGATAVVIGVPGGVGAASPAAIAVSDDGVTTTTTADGATAPDTSTDTSTGGTGATRPDRGERVTEALQPLIDDGTLTQAQADAVIATLEDIAPFGGGHGGHGGTGGGGYGRRGGVSLDSAATTLGVSAADLRSALADGKSIADVATEQGVDLQTVIDALVADASARIDQQVTDGKLTVEEAATKKAELTERITEAVNQAGGFGAGMGGGSGGPHGQRPTDGDTPPTTSDASPDTTTGG